MLKELGLVVTGVTIGVVGTLYVTKEFILEGFAHKLSEVIDEEVQDMKDELYNEKVEKDNKHYYSKPLRKSGKYPWGEQVDRDNKRDYTKPLRSYATMRNIKPALENIFVNRKDAEVTLNRLVNHISEYGSASIADYYELVAIEPEYSDHSFGWTDLVQARIEVRDEGYTIVLPIAHRLGVL